MEADTEQSMTEEGEAKRARKRVRKIFSCVKQLHKGDEVLSSDLRNSQLKEHMELTLKQFRDRRQKIVFWF